jgi:general secretion pathway protein B
MSYILDALKRAESERSRGAVPNIHAQPVLAGGSDGDEAAAGWLTWAVVAVAVMVLAAAGWWWAHPSVTPVALTSEPPAPPFSSPQGPSQSTALPMPLKPAVPAMVTPAPSRAFKPMPTDAATKSPTTASVARPVAATLKQASKATTPASTPASALTAEARVYAVKDLPNDIRSILPVVTVGGASYSESPASRMLIINGQIYHEGDKLTPDLTLQQIKLRTAVLSFRGYRYAISY